MGITTVCGNVPAALGAKNALKILKRYGRLDIPVYVGEEKPLRREYVSAQDTHGEDGMGDSGLSEVEEVSPLPGAVDFLNRTLKEQQEVSVIALGPLTNVAKALEADPQAWRRLREFVSMGGSFKSFGNCSPVAEYNYWCDPDAAAFVYEKPSGPDSYDRAGRHKKDRAAPGYSGVYLPDLPGRRGIYPENHTVLLRFFTGNRKKCWAA